MSKIFGTFLFKLVLTVIISVFIGYQIAKIEFGYSQHSFRKILGAQTVVDRELESLITNFLADKQGDYAVYVKDLSSESGRNASINSDQQFEAASLYKLFLMGAVFDEVNAGKLTLDTEISAKMSHLDEVLGGRDFGYENYDSSESIGYTVREALERIATFSDNYAAIMLAEKIGWAKMQLLAEEIGTTQTSIKSPISTSAADVGLLLEKLYRGEIVSVESSEQILDMLSKSQMNNRIPALLPKEVKIAHKTGELSGVRNDAGVVFLEGNPYVIVMMSKNLKGEDDGIESLAQISKIVYDYYTSNPK
jgi:beta-lactamase class A